MIIPRAALLLMWLSVVAFVWTSIDVITTHNPNHAFLLFVQIACFYVNMKIYREYHP